MHSSEWAAYVCMGACMQGGCMGPCRAGAAPRTGPCRGRESQKKRWERLPLQICASRRKRPAEGSGERAVSGERAASINTHAGQGVWRHSVL